MSYNGQIIKDCFNHGSVGEDCDDCPAHPRNAEEGERECCFGTDHEYGHKDCKQCSYETDCARITHGRSYQKPRRVVVRSTPVTRTSRLSNSSLLIDDEPNRNLRTEDSEVPDAAEGTFVRKLARVTGWGMIEGGLQMALSFFQRNRPN